MYLTLAFQLLLMMPESDENIDGNPSGSSQVRAPNNQLVEEVFSMFQCYLATQLEVQDKHLEETSKLSKDAGELKFKGNRKQFELNANHIFKQIEENIEKPLVIKKLIEEGQLLIKIKRQKLIKLADRSKDGWQVAQAYESDDLASNSDDDRKAYLQGRE